MSGHGPELLSLAPADGWAVVGDDGQRLPLVCWALLSDPCSAPHVVGLVVAEDGETVELAPVGVYERDVSEVAR